MTHEGEPRDVASFDLRRRARDVALAALAASGDDIDGAFPDDGVRALHATGLLLAPFPVAIGGEGLGTDGLVLHDVLVTIGGGSLALGRLYEGHVNAVLLVGRYGSAANMRLLLEEARAGRLTGVWMAEADRPLRLVTRDEKAELVGGKVLCSGTGRIRRPLVAAGRDSGGAIMLLPQVEDPARCGTEAWTATGMKATATGSVDFEGIAITSDEIVGEGDDYLRSPVFRGGAWRVLAVQLGGLTALFDAYRTQLLGSKRDDDPIQRARFGEAALAVETARLWVRQACLTAEGDGDPAAIDAYVDLARNAFEQQAVRAITLAQKGIGLKACLRPNPIERLVRDLSTYLRQPSLDLSLDAAARHLLTRSRRNW